MNKHILNNMCWYKKIRLCKLKYFSKIKLIRGQLAFLISLILVFSFSFTSLNAQSKQSNTRYNTLVSKFQDINGITTIISVSKVQNLTFGSFCTGSTGGKVIVPSNGSRSKTGTVILIPSHTGSPAIFQVRATTIRSISISISNIVSLTDGFGHSMALQVNNFYPASPFIPIIGYNNVKIGGTITVGTQASNPAGNYSGSFRVTFNGN
jgi:Domain of unknown function (DUF4402)